MTNAIWLVANSASGSNSQDAVHAVLAAFTQVGRPVTRVVEIADGVPQAGALDEAGAGLLAVFAGDGTVNAVAAALEGWHGALLILPGGTTNLLARALHGDRAAPEIVAMLPGFSRIRRNCIRTGQGPALVEVVAGPGATWCDVREELRDGAIGQMAEKAVTAFHQCTQGAMVALVCPALGRADGYAALRMEITAATMTVSAYGVDTAADYLKQGLALLRRNFREGPHDDLGRHERIVCRSLETAPIPLMIDGERRDGGVEERFLLAPFALDLLGSPG